MNKSKKSTGGPPSRAEKMNNRSRGAGNNNIDALSSARGSEYNKSQLPPTSGMMGGGELDDLLEYQQKMQQLKE